MKKRYRVLLCGVLCACQAGLVWADGNDAVGAGDFALKGWSARGLALAGGMVGRADDPSALAYNAAGMTQLSGTRVMGGFDLHVPTGSIDARMNDGSRKSTDTRSNLWATPHAYVTHQLDDRFWVGLGVFSRFGADNEFSDSWFGRYNMTSAQARTISFVPSLAMKVNDAWSVSAGVEVMYADFAMTRQIPSMQYIGPLPQKGPDSKERRTSTGWGMGLHLGSHWRMTDALSLGVAYKSPVTLRLNGRAEYSVHQSNMLADQGEVPHTVDTDTDTKIHLPGSLALGLAYKPMDNLSVEVGTVFTHWSRFDYDTTYHSGFDEDGKGGGRNSWNVNASVEYKPRQWLALRAGVWHDTSAVRDHAAGFMSPGDGSTGVGLGVGMNWGPWTLDLAYAYRRSHDLDYRDSGVAGVISSVSNISSAHSRDVEDNIVMATISYAY